MAFAQTDKSGDEPPFSFPLGPNMAFAQSNKGGDQPSASFSLTVVSGTSCNDPSPDPENVATINADIIYGSPDADNINGDNGNDQIFGCAGNDNLNGENGNDLVDGGEGDDHVNGGTGGGDDVLIGGPGDDTLDGGNGGDTLTGGEGADTFNCGNGPDKVTDYEPGIDEQSLAELTAAGCEMVQSADTTPPVLTVPDDITVEATERRRSCSYHLLSLLMMQ